MKHAFCLVLIVAGASACRQDMYNQPKAKPYSESELFRDETSARPIPLHTVLRSDAGKDDAFFTGLTNNILVTQLPMKLTPELLARGRERFDIFCATCHGRTPALSASAWLGFTKPALSA